MLRASRVAAVLVLDLARDHVVLIRQFRLPAHLATGRGDLVEIVAGRVEPDEAAIDAASRECVEEIGLAPQRLVELYSVLSTPGVVDEYVTFFLGFVESIIPTGFMCIVSGYYTQAEQSLRQSWWFSSTGLFTIIGANQMMGMKR